MDKNKKIIFLKNEKKKAFEELRRINKKAVEIVDKSKDEENKEVWNYIRTVLVDIGKRIK